MGGAVFCTPFAAEDSATLVGTGPGWAGSREVGPRKAAGSGRWGTEDGEGGREGWGWGREGKKEGAGGGTGGEDRRGGSLAACRLGAAGTRPRRRRLCHRQRQQPPPSLCGRAPRSLHLPFRPPVLLSAAKRGRGEQVRGLGWRAGRRGRLRPEPRQDHSPGTLESSRSRSAAAAVGPPGD